MLLITLLTISMSISFSNDAMDNQESKIIYVPVLVKENGRLVTKLAMKVNNYNPNPRLTLDIHQPFPKLEKNNPEKAILEKFPLDLKNLHLYFSGLLKPHLYEDIKDFFPNTFLLRGDIKRDARYLVELIHNEFQLPLVHVKGEQFLDNYHAVGSRKVDKFMELRGTKERPLLLFIEDFDPIAAKPSQSSGNAFYEWLSSKSAFRFDFDRLENDRRVILLASTKDRYELDEGIISRFAGFNIPITKMTFKQRVDLLTYLCKDLAIENKESTIKSLAYAAKGLSRKSLTEAIDCVLKTIPTSKDTSYQEKISEQELLKAITQARDQEDFSWNAYFKLWLEC